MTKLIPCDACGAEAPTHNQDSIPDNGWVMPYEDFGYYGGFSDHDTYGRRPKHWFMCHDCVVKFLNTFPALAKSVGAGTHGCEDDTPCCNHAWRGTELFGQDVWGVHTQKAVDGKWVDDPPSSARTGESREEFDARTRPNELLHYYASTVTGKTYCSAYCVKRDAVGEEITTRDYLPNERVRCSKCGDYTRHNRL
jgi:hypothetical protein